MLTNIARIVEQFKQSWCDELEDEAILQAVAETGHVWRDRKLNPLTTIRLFLLQILFGNTACNHVPHLAAMDVTGSAYCEARGRLPLEALQTLLSRATTKMAECVQGTGLWLSHRLFLVDGSSFSMPDTDELREHFGQSGQQAAGCGFPTAHWLALVHFGSGLFQKVIASALRTHDLSGAVELHPELQAGDVLVGDRAFCSFAHLALLMSRGVHGLVRAHQKLIIDFTPGREHTVPGQGKTKTNSASRAHVGFKSWGRGTKSSSGSARWRFPLGSRRRPSPTSPQRSACENFSTTSPVRASAFDR